MNLNNQCSIMDFVLKKQLVSKSVVILISAVFLL